MLVSLHTLLYILVFLYSSERWQQAHWGHALIEYDFKQCGPLYAKINDKNAWLLGMEIWKKNYIYRLY